MQHSNTVYEGANQSHASKVIYVDQRGYADIYLVTKLSLC